MSRPRGWAVPRHLTVPALALAVVATLPVTGSPEPAPGFDVDALVGYLGAGTPVAPGPADRNHQARLSRRWLAPTGLRPPPDTVPPDGRFACILPADVGILVSVIQQAHFYFYYGSGSPAAVGSA